jgi:hypothetical protein
LPPSSYEETLQAFLISALYARVGEPGTLRGQGRTAQFDLKKSLGGGDCKAKAPFTLNLPKEGTLEHTADILVQDRQGRRLAVELEWAASEPDSIKACAYDMLLLKQGMGEKLWGMMIYLRPAAGGVSADQAREICFPYDQFFAIEHQDPQNPAAWVPILDRIEAEIASRS